MWSVQWRTSVKVQWNPVVFRRIDGTGDHANRKKLDSERGTVCFLSGRESRDREEKDEGVRGASREGNGGNEEREEGVRPKMTYRNTGIHGSVPSKPIHLCN